ncbi:precorrin-2 C(20)-methyltransferase [Intestinimonas sp.]|uniref:precorrin-2 C(20)-methyltransferase n=1 Tax=Intestinimonas sp. TaxID=1965293 RepID=UPI0026326049|nr:precorrin-2 C(20)-methyltransferase [Intestinimonas sp.]
MERGKLYGVGVGPGDPELVTKKAERILREADIVAVPDKGVGEKTALHIVSDIVAGKELLYCPTPMVRDRTVLESCYEQIAGEICARLDEGKNVAFITLGDPTVYSTYIYVHKKVLARGYAAELIPGVPSFCAVAARLNTSLCEGAERLLIVPASHDAADCLDIRANKVFMKAGKAIGELREQLAERDMLDGAALVANCGMEGELVCPHFADMTDGAGYFSIVLVKE